MPPLASHYATLLEQMLTDKFVPYLPALLDQTKPADQQQRKNLSRAFAAFALHHLCGVSERDAAQAVVDDFDDIGVDAIFYHSRSETLYLVQAKLKTSEAFRQEEALAFCQGVRKLIKQDFSGFNSHVQNRVIEIEDALDNCSHLQLVVAHTGSDISNHAKAALDDLLHDENHGEERFASTPLDYDASRVVAALQDAHAYESVHADLCIQKCYSIKEPRTTYFGLMQLKDLVILHERYGKALYDKNIRTFLGTQTDVNTSIRQTLEERPAEFLYLNNGIAALCQKIDPKGQKSRRNGCKRLNSA